MEFYELVEEAFDDYQSEFVYIFGMSGQTLLRGTNLASNDLRSNIIDSEFHRLASRSIFLSF